MAVETPPRRRVRRRVAAAADDGGGEVDDDGLSVLPDELLLVILGRLDTRTALAAAALSRRLDRLAREIPALEFSVRDVLPPRYHACVRARRAHGGAAGADARKLDAAIGRCERRAIRGFADCVSAFMEPRVAVAPRRAKRLRLEFFAARSTGFVEDLIAMAVGAWAVEDLDITVVKPALVEQGPCYTFCFPDHRLSTESLRSRVRNLAVSNCFLPPPSELRHYAALAKLVLQDTHPRTPLAFYRQVLDACPRLRALHLRRCGAPWYAALVVDGMPELRELVVDGCGFHTVDLRAAPALERVACVDGPVALAFGGAPRLARLSLTYELDDRLVLVRNWRLFGLLGDAPAMAELLVRFTGEPKWMTSGPLRSPLPGLRRLVVADMPSNWDVSWPRVILEAAPCLEVLHIHVQEEEEDEAGTTAAAAAEIPWPPAESARHERLAELAVVGFAETRGQVGFVRHVVEACVALRRVVLVRRGRVVVGGEGRYWDWKLVAAEAAAPREGEVGGGGGDGERPTAAAEWSEVEKMVIRSQVKSASRPDVEVFIG